MAITPGSHIGPYEVVSQLGEGGMGVVFRGRDSRLQRDVALKVLPDNFASDPDRLSRFQREAQVLASLNHAHIAQIYGLEHVEGAACIVMELVEGETLEEKLRKGPFSYDEAIDISRQIADALSAAHERGVVHRDLKPANIKIMSNGTVKVLDFGLAKALGPKTSDTNITALPTMASGSMVGAIVGTPGYMSPEQARGKDVDARTDIWAFGCVLYEMLTAKQAFTGETVTDIMAKIVTSPPDLEQLPKTTPPSIRLLLSSVLNKNATQRLQHIGDTRLFLEGTLVPADATATAPQAQSKSGKLVAAALLIALVATAIPAVLYFRSSPPAQQPMRFDLTLPSLPTVSPDGQTLGYSNVGADGKRMLWVRPINSEAGQQIAGTEGIAGFGFSPDGKKVLFVADGKIKKVDLAGGSTQVIANFSGNRGADWNSKGTILIARSSDGIILKVPETGGELTPVTKFDPVRKDVLHALPTFLPDDNHFLYVAAGGTPEAMGIFLTSLDGETPTRIINIVPNAFNAMSYVDPGYLVYSNERKIIAQRLDASGHNPGDPVTIAEDVDGGAFSISNTGLLFYHKSVPPTQKQLLWFGHDGKPLGALGNPANYNNLDLSPKGDKAAVDQYVDNNRDVWVIDLARAVPQRITFDARGEWSSTWSPDGSRLMFASARGANKIIEKSATGAGQETEINVGDASAIPVNWSPDGKYLIYSQVRANGNGFEPWLLPLFGEKKPTPFLQSQYDRIHARISPDSRYVAYTTNESGTQQIVVQTFPDPNGGKWQISGEGGVEPKWRHDGRELYYLALDGKMMAVPITGSPTFTAGKPTALFQTQLTVNKGNPTRDRRYDVTPDGRFLMVIPAASGPALPHTALVNWYAALEKK
jgi:serine/threonine protein kinase/Tol biopolymer transport system component